MQPMTTGIENDPSPANERRRALMVAAVAGVVLYIIWNTPGLNVVLAPLRLFVTYIHEAGHSLAAIMTGGRVLGFTVSPDGSGLARTAGGVRWVVISGGYLGAALFGSGLFYLANRYSAYDRLIAVVLGIFMIVFTLRFGRPDEGFRLTVYVIGISFGMLLILAGGLAPRIVTLLVLDVLAISTALNAVLDVWYLVGNIGAARGIVRNDAVAYSQQIMNGLVPATWIALLWAGTAALMFGTAVYYGVWKPLRDEVDSTYQRRK